MVVTGLFVYPVKGLGGISLTSSTLLTTGLPFDRQWMLVDHKGNFVTQRQLPALATISCGLTDDGLTLSHKDNPPLRIGLSEVPTDTRPVTVWQDQQLALDEGDEASAWLTDILGTFRRSKLSLVRFSPQDTRAVSAKHLSAGESSKTFFSDGYPYLITSEASLTVLNQSLAEEQHPAVTMDRFRPNIVVDALAKPFEELFPQDLVGAEGKLQLGIRKPCERCPVTTIDQVTGERTGKEPLPALTRLNPLADKKGAYFGGNAILLGGEGVTLSIGDALNAVAIG